MLKFQPGIFVLGLESHLLYPKSAPALWHVLMNLVKNFILKADYEGSEWGLKQGKFGSFEGFGIWRGSGVWYCC